MRCLPIMWLSNVINKSIMPLLKADAVALWFNWCLNVFDASQLGLIFPAKVPRTVPAPTSKWQTYLKMMNGNHYQLSINWLSPPCLHNISQPIFFLGQGPSHGPSGGVDPCGSQVPMATSYVLGAWVWVPTTRWPFPGPSFWPPAATWASKTLGKRPGRVAEWCGDSWVDGWGDGWDAGGSSQWGY